VQVLAGALHGGLGGREIGCVAGERRPDNGQVLAGGDVFAQGGQGA